jgi:hypothetical protein
LIENKKSTQNIKYKLDINSFTKDNNVPESAIGYKEGFIRTLFMDSGLNIVEPIHYVSWCGRKDFMSYQDIIVAEKNFD